MGKEGRVRESFDETVERGLTAATPRRNVLKGAGGLALGALGLGGREGSGDVSAAPAVQDATPTASASGKRPNVVMIMSDDFR